MADKTASGSGGSSAQDSSKKVGLIGLVGIVISAMIGGGIYNLPQNMAADASAGAIIIAWVVTGIGIWFIANTFRILSAARPELTNGLYTYAEKGFGKLIGFFVAYGYWICNCFALVAYSVLVMATLNYFVPDFTGGNNIPSIIGGSIITWIMYLLALRGAKSTSFLNIIGTIGKLLPVFIFILAVATVFKFSVFMEGFWGMKDGVALTLDFSNVMPQVSSTMLVTLWLFLGIEGAVVVSGKAKSQAAVRKATTIGFLVTLALYIVVSLLPLGVYSQAEVGSMADPSMAAIMLKSFGKWGEIMVNAGVIVSVLSSWLVWMLMLGEMPLAASKSGIFPKMFVKENKNGSPSTSLLWTTIVVQVVLIISFFIGNNAWTTMISITSVMALPCYFFCTLFLFKIAVKKEYPSGIFASRGMAVFTGAAGSLYGLWLIYAAGLNYLMVACIVYAIGLPLYIVGVRQHDRQAKLFEKRSDKVILADSVPGVSGGTVAFLLGFYDRFIGSLDDLFHGARAARFAAVRFLLKLGAGWAIGFGLSALVLTSFFDTHIYEVSSLFMGFIVFAIPIVVREELDALRKRLPYLAFAVVGVAFVVAVTLLSPVSGEGIDVAAKSLDLGLVAYVFLAAMAAISAMVLPGISGSTLLLIFGLYVPIMGAVRATMGLDLSYLPILMVFAAGIACGMLLFVRLIRMCLERFRSQTIYAIIGMMLGSLFSITQGPLTLSEPQPAMSLDTFSIVFFLIGGAVVGGLQLLRSRLEEPAEG